MIITTTFTIEGKKITAHKGIVTGETIFGANFVKDFFASVRDFFGGRYIGADVSSPPFDKLAELYGAAGFRADTLPEMAAAIEAALVCGKPAVIDVAVDPAALYSFRRDSFKHRGG